MTETNGTPTTSPPATSPHVEEARTGEARIHADPEVPVIRITRDFDASPQQLFRAHTDPDLFAQWIGPDDTPTTIDHWDATSGGSWRFTSVGNGQAHSFRGCFHDVRTDRIVQTFTWEGQPDDVALETMWFEDLGDGRTRLHVQSLVDSFEGRDAWLRSGMEVGVNQGYAKLDQLLAATPAVHALSIRERYERAADGFDAQVRAMTPSGWDADSPCRGWTGRDVLNHITEWVPAVFCNAGLTFDPADTADPIDRWSALDSALRSALADPTMAGTTMDVGPMGKLTVAVAIDQIVTPDVIVHSWDLARAGGLDDTIDPDLVDWMLTMVDSTDAATDEAMRASEHFGPRIDVDEAADAQTRVLAFYGRAR